MAIYLLLGIMFGLGYQLLDLVESGAFTSAGAALAREDRDVSLMYFSLVTLSTLGYGDIVPVSRGARGLATLEAVLGQAYLAILVARLVGLHLVGAGARGEPES